jgi:hypothetical protein
VNRANLKFTNLITTTSRVSVRNIIESAREGAKLIASEKLPARTTTQLVSLVLFTIEMIATKNEKKKQSKRKSSKEHNKSLSLITKALCGIERGFDHLGVSRIEC